MGEHYDRYNGMQELLATDINAATKDGTNLAEVGTDCISREQVINAFNTNINELVVAGKENADSVLRYLNRVIDEIKQLPPIQPDNNSENPNSSDVVSRQEAIDAVQNRHMMLSKEKVLLINDLEKLPSVEPKRETATVSVGKSKGGVTMWYECAACGEPVDQGDTFCSGCGRRLIHE